MRSFGEGVCSTSSSSISWKSDEILVIPESRQSVEEQGDSRDFLVIWVKWEILEFPSVKRPLLQWPLFLLPIIECLSVNSPALILSKNSGVFLAKIG